MLSLVTHEPFFVLLREKISKRKQNKDAMSYSPEDFELLEISLLRKMLNQHFRRLEMEMNAANARITIAAQVGSALTYSLTHPLTHSLSYLSSTLTYSIIICTSVIFHLHSLFHPHSLFVSQSLPSLSLFRNRKLRLKEGYPLLFLHGSNWNE